MKVTYDTARTRWDIRWTLPAAKDGPRYRYGRARIQDPEFLTLTKKEQKARLREMEAYAARKEQEAAKDGPDNAAALVYPAPRRTLAAAVITSMPRYARSTAAKVTREAKGIAAEFVEFLNDRHPGTAITAITPQMAREYVAFLHARRLAMQSIRQRVKRMGWIMRELAATRPALTIPNPFDGRELLRTLPPAEIYHRDTISPRDYARMLHAVMTPYGGIFPRGGNDERERMALNAFAALYLGIVTGWRKGDIVGKRWADIDLGAGTIHNLHHKTRTTSGARSTLPLTALGKLILSTLRDINGGGECVFRFTDTPARTPEKQAEKNAVRFQYICDKIFDKLGMTNKAARGVSNVSTVSFHSLRGTVISHLISHKVPESLVRALVGHAGDSIERKHYVSFSLEDYANAVAMLEAEFVRAALVRKFGKGVYAVFVPIIRALDAVRVNPARMVEPRYKAIMDKMAACKMREFLAAAGLSADDMRYFYKFAAVMPLVRKP